MKPVQAKIYQRQQTNNSGTVSTDYPVQIGTVMGALIPTGGMIVQKIYGLEYSGEFEFYPKKRHDGLIEGNRLIINEKLFDIQGTRDYIKTITCLLRAVTDNG